jgi:hypothetical protein
MPGSARHRNGAEGSHGGSDDREFIAGPVHCNNPAQRRVK